jgi:3-phenylpropionate/trans-cinnamate dioxygenase ferredoxin subunit
MRERGNAESREREAVGYIPVAAVEEIPPGTAKLVHVGDYKVAVFNVDGTFHAIDDVCTHEEASLAAGPIYGDIVACPKHGSRFHIPTGRVLSLPAVVPVDTYPIKVEGGQVWVLPDPRRGHGMPHKA